MAEAATVVPLVETHPTGARPPIPGLVEGAQAVEPRSSGQSPTVSLDESVPTVSSSSSDHDQAPSTVSLVHSESTSPGPAPAISSVPTLTEVEEGVAPVAPSTADDGNKHAEKTSHAAQPSERMGKPAWRQWLPEILYCFVSLSSLMVIIAVLRTYEGRALPKLPMDITLNTFLAFFATFSKAAFCTVLTEALSQWKWNMTKPDTQEGSLGVGHTCKVSDFELVDKASRGPWGSCLLVWSFKWRHFITLAAALSLISSFTSPITQQMIAYPLRTAAVEGEASVPFARDYVNNSTSGRAAFITSAVNEASYANIEAGPIDHVPAKCGSNDCRFELYSSLAVCTKAANVSHLLEVNELKNSTWEDWTATGEWGHFDSLFYETAQEEERLALDGNGTAPTIFSTAWNATLPHVNLSFVTPISYAILYTARVPSLAFSDSHNDMMTTFLRTYFIWSNAGNVSYPGYNRSADPVPWSFQAVEIIYYACVNTYNTTYHNGISETRVVASSNVPLPVPENLPPNDVTCDHGPIPLRTWEERCRFNSTREQVRNGLGYTYLSDPAAPGDLSSSYRFDRALAGQITLALNQAISGFFYYNGLPGTIMSFDPAGTANLARRMYGINGLRTEDIHDPVRQFKLMYPYFEGFATSLSNMIRTVPGSMVHHGLAFGQENWVKINWGWVSFLTAEILLSYIFLAVTVYRTIKLKTPVLKSSELATILASTEEICCAVGSIDDIDEASKRSKTVKMKLQDGRFVVDSVPGSDGRV